MSKKPSKSMGSNSAINKSALSKSSAGKSSMGKKRATEEGKSKTVDNQQRPSDPIEALIGGNSGYSGLPPPPPYFLDDEEAINRYWAEQFTDVQRQSLNSLTGRIKDRHRMWKFVKEQLAAFESKKVNDQRQPPPLPKYDEKDYESTRKALSEYLHQLGDEVSKMEAELKQLQLMAKEKASLPKKADDAPKSVQIVQMSKREPAKKQRPWAIILIAIGLTALVVVALVGLVVGVVLASKSDDVKTRASKGATIEAVPDGQTGEASTSNGKTGGQGGGNTAPITTSSTAMSTTTTVAPPVNDFEIVCKGQGPEECLIGSAPGSCSDGAVCWQLKFVIIDMNGGINKFTINDDNPPLPPPSTDQKRMCKTDDGQLGSCDRNDQCNLDDRLIGKKANEAAEWKDNCDEPIPCWEGSFPGSVELERKHCKQTSCAAYKHAAIWMQHMRCYAGNGRTANETCQGLPLRLWVCGRCPYDSDILTGKVCSGGKVKPIADGCTLECSRSGGRAHVVVPDGFACNFTDPADGQKPGHCFGGQCFPIFSVYNETDPIENVTECMRIREADKKMQAAFMRGRRGAINFNDITVPVRSMSEDGSPKVASEKPTEFPIKSEDVEKKPHDE